MEYLRSKVAQTHTLGDHEDDGPVQHTDSAYESGDRENASKTKTSVPSEYKKQNVSKKTAKKDVSWSLVKYSIISLYFLTPCFYFQTEPMTEFTVKLRGAPFNVKEVSWQAQGRHVLCKTFKHFFV